MLNRLANYVDNIYSAERDPKKIPAKLHLEGLGEMAYSVSSYNAINGKTTKIVADDPKRTFYFVPAPGKNGDAIAPPCGMARRTAMLAAYGMAVGATCVTLGACSGNLLMVGLGVACLVSAALLFKVAPHKDVASGPPYRPTRTGLARQQPLPHFQPNARVARLRPMPANVAIY